MAVSAKQHLILFRALVSPDAQKVGKFKLRTYNFHDNQDATFSFEFTQFSTADGKKMTYIDRRPVRELRDFFARTAKKDGWSWRVMQQNESMNNHTFEIYVVEYIESRKKEAAP